MKINKYQVVVGSVSYLRGIVNDEIVQGWLPYGSPTFVIEQRPADGHENKVYGYQAMVKYDEI
jgi:hypothetical protein